MCAIADEDLERENDEKTSVGALPALRADARRWCAQVKAGAAISVGIDHDELPPRSSTAARQTCAIRSAQDLALKRVWPTAHGGR